MTLPSAVEVYPSLWLGDIEAAKDITFLKMNNIGCIINCTKGMHYADLPTKKYRLAVKDNLKIDQIFLMYQSLDQAVGWIVQNLPRHNVLVHCHAGRQRSVSVILAFLIKCADIQLDEALKYVQSKREIAGLPKLNFMKALQQYSIDIQNLKGKL